MADTAGGDFTKDNRLTQAYDSTKVDAVLNEIAGRDHSGSRQVGAPAVFGMDFQTVSTAQKLPASDGYQPGGAPGRCCPRRWTTSTARSGCSGPRSTARVWTPAPPSCCRPSTASHRRIRRRCAGSPKGRFTATVSRSGLNAVYIGAAAEVFIGAKPGDPRVPDLIGLARHSWASRSGPLHVELTRMRRRVCSGARGSIAVSESWKAVA